MISAITTEPVIAAGAQLADYRHRTSPGARALLHDSTPMTDTSPGAGNDSQFTPPDRQNPAQSEPERRESGSSFAAAVLSGALPPTPQSLSELIRRIGNSPIPAESQARLKDLTA